MKLENQYTTADQGKRLVELGIDPDMANYFWVPTQFEPFKLVSSDDMDFAWRVLPEDESRRILFSDRSPAFNVAELSVMLAEFAAGVTCGPNAQRAIMWHAVDVRTSNMADAYAQHLINVLTDGHLAAAECNERLKNA